MFFLGKMLFPKKFDMKNMTYPDYSSSFGQPWVWRGSSTPSGVTMTEPTSGLAR